MTSGGLGQSDELINFLGKVEGEKKPPLDGLIPHHTGQSIGTEQEKVSVHSFPPEEVDRQTLLHSHSPQNHVAERMPFGFHLGNKTLIDLILNQGMIPGELPHLPLAQTVSPAVPYMSKNIMRAAKGHLFGCTAHSLMVFFFGQIPNPGVDRTKG